MEHHARRSRRLTPMKLLELATLSYLMVSQECKAMGALEDTFPHRKLLQGDPGMGEAPPLGTAISPQIIVDAGGGGDYTTVQAAVNAVPDGNPQRLVIRIFAGNYV